MMNFKNVLKNKKTAVLLLNMVLMSSAHAMWEEEFETQQRTSISEHKKKKDSYRLSVKNTVEEHLKKYPDLLDSSKGKDIVVFLGNTGAGKSTLINYLSEKELKADRFKSIILNNPNDISAMEIGAGASSKTLLPQSIEVEGTLFYDLPGFGDTRGTSVNLVNACLIKNIIEEAKSVKLIFVAGVDQITADRGKPFNIFLEKIRHLIPNKEIEDFSSLVITKSDQKRNCLGEYLSEKVDEISILESWIKKNKIDQMSKPKKRKSKINLDERGNILDLIRRTDPQKIEDIKIDVIYDETEKNKIETIYSGEMEEIIEKIIESKINPEQLSNLSMEELKNTKDYVNYKFLDECESNFESSDLLNFLRPMSTVLYEESKWEMGTRLREKQELIRSKIEGEISQKTVNTLQTKIEGMEELVENLKATTHNAEINEMSAIEQARERADNVRKLSEDLNRLEQEQKKREKVIKKREEERVNQTLMTDQALMDIINQTHKLDSELLSLMSDSARSICVFSEKNHWENRISRIRHDLILYAQWTVGTVCTALPVTLPLCFWRGMHYFESMAKLKEAEAIWDGIPTNPQFSPAAEGLQGESPDGYGSYEHSINNPNVESI